MVIRLSAGRTHGDTVLCQQAIHILTHEAKQSRLESFAVIAGPLGECYIGAGNGATIWRSKEMSVLGPVHVPLSLPLSLPLLWK